MMDSRTFSGTAATISVLIYPGATTLTVIPLRAFSWASAFVKPIIPAFAAE